MEEELKNKDDECLIGEVGDTAEPELQDEAKKKESKKNYNIFSNSTRCNCCSCNNFFIDKKI